MAELTIILRDRIAEQVSQLPDPQHFVERAVEDALRSQPPASEEGVSKWARIAAQIESLPGLGGYAEVLRRDQEEFRRSFRFKHDEP